MAKHDQEKKFIKEYYRQLVGMTVEKVGIKVEDMGGYEAVFPVLFFKQGERRWSADISRDSEGNGPGFLHMTPIDRNDKPIEA